MTDHTIAPGLQAQAPGPAEGIGLDDANLLLEILPDAKTSKTSTFAFEHVLHGRQTVPLGGRNRWLMRKLIERGNRGLTAAELPAGVRVSALILNLRRAGIAITSEVERHSGDFPGNHCRYFLDVRVTEIR